MARTDATGDVSANETRKLSGDFSELADAPTDSTVFFDSETGAKIASTEFEAYRGKQVKNKDGDLFYMLEFPEGGSNDIAVLLETFLNMVAGLISGGEQGIQLGENNAYRASLEEKYGVRPWQPEQKAAKPFKTAAAEAPADNTVNANQTPAPETTPGVTQ